MGKMSIEEDRKKNTEYNRKWRKIHLQEAYYQNMKNNFTSYFKLKYKSIKWRCNDKCKNVAYRGLSVMSRHEWDNFIAISRPILEPMYESYKKSGYSMRISPSIDRINTKIGYVVGNCRWLPQWENASLAKMSRKTCANGHLYTSETLKLYRGFRYCRVCQVTYRRAWALKNRSLKTCP